MSKLCYRIQTARDINKICWIAKQEGDFIPTMPSQLPTVIREAIIKDVRYQQQLGSKVVLWVF